MGAGRNIFGRPGMNPLKSANQIVQNEVVTVARIVNSNASGLKMVFLTLAILAIFRKISTLKVTMDILHSIISASLQVAPRCLP